MELQPLERMRVCFYSGAVAIGQTLFAAMGLATSPILNVHGHRRIVGNFHALGGAAPAAGFPRVRQFSDQANVSLVTVLAQDFSQADNQFPFDLPVSFPFVQIEYTNGGVAGTLRVSVGVYPE